MDGMLWLAPCSSVHGLGMRIDLDVAYLDRQGRVLDVARLRRWSVHRPRRRARTVVEAAPGAMERAGVRVGSVLALEGIAAEGSDR
jgi:uncharacterized membrane protein (UPF0127 family)